MAGSRQMFAPRSRIKVMEDWGCNHEDDLQRRPRQPAATEDRRAAAH